MHKRFDAHSAMNGVYHTILGQLRSAQFRAYRAFVARASLRLHVEALPPRMLFSVTPTMNLGGLLSADTVPGPQSTVENQPLTFSSGNNNAISAGSLKTAVGMSASNGTLTLLATAGLTFINGTKNGSHDVQFNGAISAINAALNGLVYTPASGFIGSDPITYITALTALGLITTFSTYTIPVTVTAPPHVNQPPIISAPGGETVAENQSLAFPLNAITVADSDANGGVEQVTLAATGGLLSLHQSVGIAITAGRGTNDQSMTFTGTLSNLNASLQQLTFTPTAGTFGVGNVTITANDLGNTGTGGSQTDTVAVPITIGEVNQPPVVLAPGRETVAENQSLVFPLNAISVTDSDANGGAEQVTLTAIGGLLSLQQSVGIAISSGTGTNDQAMTFTGTLPNLNASLQQLTFTPTTGTFGSGSVTITANDLGNSGTGGSKTDTVTVPITITEVNQPPTLGLPSLFNSAENSPVVFSTTDGNAIVAADSDSSGQPEQISLSTTVGTLSLASTSGVTFVSGGDGTSSMVIQGTLANLNTAMNGLALTPPTSFVGSVTLNVGLNDLGNTGQGGAKTAAGVTTINVVSSVVVTTAGDLADGNTSSISALENNAGPDGAISLREAILAANNTPGLHVIQFDIAGGGAQTIDVASPLPAISNSVIIDGTTQPGYSGAPLVGLDGQSAAFGTIGLSVETSDCTIKGLAIFGFSGNGIDVLPVGANNITIQGNFVGITQTGVPNFNGDGVVLANSANDTVGGFLATQRNVISGNYYEGVHIFGAGSTNDTLIGNYIGTNPAGTAAVPNGGIGVYVDGASQNTIGSTAAGGENIIAYNAKGVVVAESGALPNTIRGNSIFGNTTIGIDLGNDGITANSGTTDSTLPNDGMNSPVFTLAGMSGGALTAAGYVGSGPNTPAFAGATIDLYKSDYSLANGQGKAFLGTLTADGNGNFAGTVNVSGLTIGDSITATATDTKGNTSEFAVNATVQAFNQPPAIAVPSAPATNENTTLVFSVSGGNAIVISDPDAHGGIEQVTVATSGGALTLAQTTGLTFINGTANGSRLVSFTGSLPDINSALDGVQFTPAAGFSGSLSLTIAVNDLGNSGAGGPKTASADLSLTVIRIAGTPSVVNSSTNENTQTSSGLIITPSGIDNPAVTWFRITNIAGGQLFQNDGITVINDGDFISAAQGIAGLKFTPTTDSTENGRFLVQASTSPTAIGLGGAVVAAAIVVKAPTQPDSQGTSGVPLKLPIIPNAEIAPAAQVLPTEVPLPVSGTPDSVISTQIPQSDLVIPATSGTEHAVAPKAPSNSPATGTTNSASPVTASPGNLATPVISRTVTARGASIELAPQTRTYQDDLAMTPPQMITLSRNATVELGLGDPLAGDKSRTTAIMGLTQHAAQELAQTTSALDSRSPLWRELDQVQDELTSTRKGRAVAGAAALASVGMSVIYFMWVVRAGSVLTSLLSSMPAWNLVDPLPILEQFSGKRRKGDGDDEDETLESLVDGVSA